MKVAILVEDNYEELELWYPYYRLLEEGIAVDIVGPIAGKTYKSKSGYPAESNKAADKVSSSDYEGIVIPGGYAPDRMRQHPAMLEFVRSVFNEGKVVAAICHAAWTLCSADILHGRTITCYFAIKDDIIHAGAHYVDEPVVVDGNLITSREPKDLPHFSKAILKALQLRKHDS